MKEDKDLTAMGRARAGETGTYVHMMNQLNQVPRGHRGSITRFTIECDGEVCFADVGDWHHATGRLKIGLLMSGPITARFSYDCWSYLNEDGTRFATKMGSTGRNEMWAVPSQMEPLAIVSNDEGMESAMDIAEELGLPVWHVKEVGVVRSASQQVLDSIISELHWAGISTFPQYLSYCREKESQEGYNSKHWDMVLHGDLIELLDMFENDDSYRSKTRSRFIESLRLWLQMD